MSDDSECKSASYWSSNVLSTVSNRTGYAQTDFMFVDGDQGRWARVRRETGSMQTKLDAQNVWNHMKESINEEGQIIEQLQLVTYSGGSAYGQGYMEAVSSEIKAMAEKEGIGFAYGEDNIIEYSVKLAPYQSYSITYPNSGSKNVNVSHYGDILSGNDADVT